MIKLRSFLFALAALAALAVPAAAQQRTQYVLAISWQPAFCETAPDRRECRNQKAGSFEATNFALHGLWPQRMNYCGLSGAAQSQSWSRLPEPELSPKTRAALETAMPGAQSGLHRHQWAKHGSCYGTDAEDYFADSLAMLEAVNASAVRDLFAANIGRNLTQRQIRAAFDEAFGRGAGQRVRIACERDGNRRIISEITVGLTGDIATGDFARLVLAARPTDGGCDAGIVDPVGLQ